MATVSKLILGAVIAPVVDGAADGSGAYGGCADAPTHIGSAMIGTPA